MQLPTRKSHKHVPSPPIRSPSMLFQSLEGSKTPPPTSCSPQFSLVGKIKREIDSFPEREAQLPRRHTMHSVSPGSLPSHFSPGSPLQRSLSYTGSDLRPTTPLMDRLRQLSLSKGDGDLAGSGLFFGHM